MQTYTYTHPCSWSYGSWIYNYLCDQCLSPLKVVSPIPVHAEVYSIHYMIKFVSEEEIRQVGGFSPNTPVSSNNKTDLHDIDVILLKVALNTITTIPTQTCILYKLTRMYFVASLSVRFESAPYIQCNTYFLSITSVVWVCKCGHRNVLSKRQAVWMSIFHII